MKDAGGSDTEQDVSPFISPTVTLFPLHPSRRHPVGPLAPMLESTEILRVTWQSEPALESARPAQM